MSKKKFHSYPIRTLCGVLEEMRDLDKVKNYSGLLGLIEEAQSLANRMEGAISAKKDIAKWMEERDDLKREMKELTNEYNQLHEKVTRLKKERGNNGGGSK